MPEYDPPRASRRVPLEARVRLRWSGQERELIALSVDISVGGIFLQTPSPLDVGSRVDLAFHLPGDQQLLTAAAEVAWVRRSQADPTSPAGMGLRFRDLPEPTRERIEHLTTQVQQEGGSPFDLTGALLGSSSTAPAHNAATSEVAPLVEILHPPEKEELERTAALRQRRAVAERQRLRRRNVVRAAAVGLAVAGAGALTAWSLLARERGEPAPPPPAPTVVAGADRGDTSPPAEEGLVETPAANPEPPPPSDQGHRLHRIEYISIAEKGGETEVTIVGDGPFDRDAYTRLHLGTPRPREVWKFRGIDAPYNGPTGGAATAQVLRVRTGYHPGRDGNELHVVFDLAGDQVHTLGIEPEGRVLKIRLATSSETAPGGT